MSILAKLKIILWTLVLVLWGSFMFQFLRKDLSQAPALKLVKNPFSSKPGRFIVEPLAVKPVLVEEPSAAEEKPAVSPQQAEVSSAPLMAPLETEGVVQFVPEDESKSRTFEANLRETEKEGEPEFPEPPQGFATSQTRHFLLYRQEPPFSAQLLSSLEALHGNLMLDLISFSPWTRDASVLIYFFLSPNAYRTATGRPAWSGGASSVGQRIIYAMEDSQAMGILAHELTHIYFDSFFSGSRPNPLWLSEGMAVYVQSERGQSPPGWLSENLEYLKQGGGFKLKDLMAVENLDKMTPAQVKLWYAQSYSVVRFLIHLNAGDAFYRFCKLLRDGSPVSESLVRAYGMPFNKVSSLEYAWRYDIKTRKITGQ